MGHNVTDRRQPPRFPLWPSYSRLPTPPTSDAVSPTAGANLSLASPGDTRTSRNPLADHDDSTAKHPVTAPATLATL